MSFWDQDGDVRFRANVDGSLSMFAGLIRKEESLDKMILTYLKDREKNTPRRLHRQDGFHASEVGQMCRRQASFKRLLPMANDRNSFDAKLLLRMEIGSAVHDRWQQNILGPMRVLRGTWECSRCMRQITNAFMPTDPCPKCGWQVNQNNGQRALPSRSSVHCLARCRWPGGYDTPGRDCGTCAWGGSWIFRETMVRIPELDLIGHCDGVLVYNAVERVLEMKSKDSFAWEKLEAPDDRHIIQAQCYMKGLGLGNATIAYVNKNSGILKEYEIKFDEAIFSSVVHDVRAVDESVATGVLPNGVCGGPNDYRAKECRYRTACFLGLDKVDEIRGAVPKMAALVDEFLAATAKPAKPAEPAEKEAQAP